MHRRMPGLDVLRACARDPKYANHSFVLLQGARVDACSEAEERGAAPDRRATPIRRRAIRCSNLGCGIVRACRCRCGWRGNFRAQKLHCGLLNSHGQSEYIEATAIAARI